MSNNNPEFYRTTYEYQSNPLNQKHSPYSPLEETKNILYKTGQERLSNSPPPIILCETGGSRNNKIHRHRYLFYPSASRLSPFDNNYNSDINIIKGPFRNENNKEEEIDNKHNLINKNETEKNPERYQAMYDKSFELVKKISELVPEENIKLKGNSDYYLNKDKDYINIIDKQIDTLTNHFKANNFNLGYKTDINLYKNNNNLPNNDKDKNMTYDQYKNNLLQKVKNSNIGINQKENNNTNNKKEEGIAFNNFDENNNNTKEKGLIFNNFDDNNNNTKEKGLVFNNYDDNNNNTKEKGLVFNNFDENINKEIKRNYINDYIKDLNSQNTNKNVENLEMNEPEINDKKNNVNLRYKNDKKKEINDNNIINEEQKYENNNEENNKNINNNFKNDINKNIIKEENNNLIPKKTNQSTQYNTLGMIQNANDNINKNQIKYQPNKDINKDLTNKISNKEEEKYPYQLIDENNIQIISSDKKPFIGELIEEQYQKGNQIFVKTKSGSIIKLHLLRGKEGEPLCYKGYPLLGKDNKFFYDKNGNIVIYPDNEFINGDKLIKVNILDTKNKNTFKDFNISKNDFEYGMGQDFCGRGIRGEFKKSKMKNKWYMFPKGNGDSKSPIIKKKEKRKRNKI